MSVVGMTPQGLKRYEKECEMKIKKAIQILETHNKWRRGAEIEMCNVTELGIAIDTIIDYVKTRDQDKI